MEWVAVDWEKKQFSWTPHILPLKKCYFQLPSWPVPLQGLQWNQLGQLKLHQRLGHCHRYIQTLVFHKPCLSTYIHTNTCYILFMLSKHKNCLMYSIIILSLFYDTVHRSFLNIMLSHNYCLSILLLSKSIVYYSLRQVYIYSQSRYFRHTLIQPSAIYRSGKNKGTSCSLLL